MDKSTVPSASSEVIGDLNREKQVLVNELSMLAGEVLATKASCLQQIPKDIKAACKLEVDYKKAPVLASFTKARRTN